MLLVALLAAGCRRDPEALTWRVPQNAPPPPPLEFALLWDVPVPFCPEELAAAGSAQAELRQGRSRIGIHLADGTEAGGAPEARPAPPLAPADAEAIDRHPEFEGHTAVVGWNRWALFALPS